MFEHRNDSYRMVQNFLKEIQQKVVELSKTDLSKIHVSQEWSGVPYVMDHLDFLAEQISGLIDGLKDAPPPELPDEIKALREQSQNQNQ